MPSRSKPAKRAYSVEEPVVLLGSDPTEIMGTRYGPILHDIMRIGLLTGCRINEMCQLRIDDVLQEQKAIQIKSGKTVNAKRVIPIHNLVWPIHLKRIKSSDDGWVFSGLTPVGQIGKEVGWLLKDLPPSDKGCSAQVMRLTFTAFVDALPRI